MADGNGKCDAAAILGRPRRTVEVDVPEWGGVVRVRGLTARGQEVINARGGASPADGLFRARLVAFTVVDEHGKRVFGDDQIEALGDEDPAILERLSKAIIEQTAWITAPAVEAAQKNSDSATSADSPSA